MATSNINIRVKRTVQSSCSPRFMDVAACDLKALKDQSCMFDSMSCFANLAKDMNQVDQVGLHSLRSFDTFH